jgi:hypothetical protein
MKAVHLIFLLLIAAAANAQTSYKGTLGTSPVTFVMYHYSDEVSLAYYVYDKYDSPIVINGNNKKGELKLTEKAPDGKELATLLFKDFDKNSQSVTGIWIGNDKKSSYKISLEKDFDITYGENVEWSTIELLQSKSTKDHYFKTLVTKEKGDFYGKISGVNIFEKGTDNLLQTIVLDCQLFGIDSVIIGDYNFDGLEDFAVFEASYAGPNTSSIYILKTEDSEGYEVSDISGTSLEFDQEAKLVYEYNQCCAGFRYSNATYKIIDNHMVLVKRVCIVFDEEIEDFVETVCE